MKKRLQYISLILILILSVGQKDIQHFIQKSIDSNFITNYNKSDDNDSDDEAEKKEFEEENELKRKKNENSFCYCQLANFCTNKNSNFTQAYVTIYRKDRFLNTSKKLLFLKFCRLIFYS